jgi:hypothetical protein
MPLGIAKSDCKLLAVGGALFVLMMGVSIVLAPPADEATSPVPSTYSAQSAGAEAAFLLLSRLHYPVRRWEGPPTELPQQGAGNAVLILADPTQLPTEKERKALADFVQAGGHLLFTGAAIRNFFPEAEISSMRPDPTWTHFLPDIPSALDRGAQDITIQPEAYWVRLDDSQLALYGDPRSAAVVSWRLGEGEILWWAGPTPLTNAGITREDNLAFFLNSVARWSAAESYRIYWDEYFHGQRGSLWSYARRSSLALGLAQAGLLAIAVIFTFSRRSGPVYNPPHVSRLSPLEFVNTLGGLYERAGAASTAVSISYVRLRSLLTRHLGLPNDTLDSELAQSAEQRLGWKNLQAADLLGRSAGASRSQKLRPSQALELVQELERHAAMLDVGPRFHEEKT